MLLELSGLFRYEEGGSKIMETAKTGRTPRRKTFLFGG
jgi:hypothetical protein